MWTDGRTGMTKLFIAFRSFANAPIIVTKRQYQVGSSPVSYLGMQGSNPGRTPEVVVSTSNKATAAVSFHVSPVHYSLTIPRYRA
jgi:hypothetical protein